MSKPPTTKSTHQQSDTYNQVVVRVDNKTKHILSMILLIVWSMAPAWAGKNPHHEVGEVTIPQLDCVIEPSEIVDVGSAVPGVVESIQADRSDLVKKGAILAELESSVEQATLDLAKARAELNTSIELRQESAALGYLTHKRNESLLKKSAISVQDMDQLKTEARIAELQVKQEQDNKLIAGLEYQRAAAILQRRIIRSPVDGVVVDRFKAIGEYVEDEPVLRVAQLDPLFVEVIVPVEFLGKITPGMQAEVIAEVPGFEAQQATVERIDRVADAASGTYGVRLLLPNPHYRIPAGLRCRLGFTPIDQHPQTAEVTDESLASSTEIPQPVAQAAAFSERITQAEAVSGSCFRIGPIKDKNLARQLAAKVESESTTVTFHEQNHSSTSGYRVFASTGSDDRTDTDKLQARLEAAGIEDRFIVLQGEYKGRLSLGYYRKKHAAKKRQRALADKGFQTEVMPIPYINARYYLDISFMAEAELAEQVKEITALLPTSLVLKPQACRHLVATH